MRSLHADEALQFDAGFLRKFHKPGGCVSKSDSTCAVRIRYEPRQPEAAVLYALVRDHIETFHSQLGAETGAVWAQDAWGKYWSWDALETSAFATWLALGICIHVPFTYRIPLCISGALIIGIFVLAFTTYLGMPYLSPAAHKGMV